MDDILGEKTSLFNRRASVRTTRKTGLSVHTESIFPAYQRVSKEDLIPKK